MKQLMDLKIETIDIVVVNLYPFKETILKEEVTWDEVIENIDIGGPTMLRSAAKNYQSVTVIVDPSDYGHILKEIKEEGKTSLDSRFSLMQKVFMHTANYDALIAQHIKKERKDTSFPETLTMTFEKVQDMRYGENTQQQAGYYKEIRHKHE